MATRNDTSVGPCLVSWNVRDDDEAEHMMGWSGKSPQTWSSKVICEYGYSPQTATVPRLLEFKGSRWHMTPMFFAGRWWWMICNNNTTTTAKQYDYSTTTRSQHDYTAARDGCHHHYHRNNKDPLFPFPLWGLAGHLGEETAHQVHHGKTLHHLRLSLRRDDGIFCPQKKAASIGFMSSLQQGNWIAGWFMARSRTAIPLPSWKWAPISTEHVTHTWPVINGFLFTCCLRSWVRPTWIELVVYQPLLGPVACDMASSIGLHIFTKYVY